MQPASNTENLTRPKCTLPRLTEEITAGADIDAANLRGRDAFAHGRDSTAVVVPLRPAV
jgi:hypothetical protein